jgi:hypothetical protein
VKFQLAYRLSLIDHLLKVRPKFHKVLALQGHVRDKQQLLDMMRRLLWQCFRDFCGAGHALHLDGKTSLMEDLYKHPDTATPIHLQRGGVSVKFRPCSNCTTAP